MRVQIPRRERERERERMREGKKLQRKAKWRNSHSVAPRGKIGILEDRETGEKAKERSEWTIRVQSLGER